MKISVCDMSVLVFLLILFATARARALAQYLRMLSVFATAGTCCVHVCLMHCQKAPLLRRCRECASSAFSASARGSIRPSSLTA